MRLIVHKVVNGHTYYYLREMARIDGKPKMIESAGVLRQVINDPERIQRCLRTLAVSIWVAGPLRPQHL